MHTRSKTYCNTTEKKYPLDNTCHELIACIVYNSHLLCCLTLSASWYWKRKCNLSMICHIAVPQRTLPVIVPVVLTNTLSAPFRTKWHTMLQTTAAFQCHINSATYSGVDHLPESAKVTAEETLQNDWEHHAKQVAAAVQLARSHCVACKRCMWFESSWPAQSTQLLPALRLREHRWKSINQLINHGQLTSYVNVPDLETTPILPGVWIYPCRHWSQSFRV